MAKTDKKVLAGAKTNQVKTPKSEKQKQRKERNLVKTGVVYIKHIPHGFYEDEMKGFFAQFGKVLRVCVARSPKTGNSKGYGYVQFVEDEVAKIAAETMNNYLMFEKILKCKVLPVEQVTAATFGNASRRAGHNCPAQRRTDRALELLAVKKGSSQKKNAQRRREAAQRRTMLRLAQLGIKYDLSGGLVQEIEPVPVTPTAGAASANTTVDSAPPPTMMEVDESDAVISFKTPPNVIKRRLSRPAASTPQSAATPFAKAATPKVETPKAATPKAVTPKAATPKAATPKAVTPKAVTPKAVTPKAATPKVVSPKAVTPKAVTPKAVTPKAATPKVVSPKAATPKVATPKAVTPKAVTPKAVTPMAATPKMPKTPKAVRLNVATPKMTKTPKAATTPSTPNSLSKKTPPMAKRLRSATKKVLSKKTPPKSARKH